MYFEISDVRDLKKNSMRTMSWNYALHKLRHFLHSYIWSDMWVGSLCLNWVRSSKPKSWWTGSWKNVRKVVSSELKLPCDAESWSMYHFVACPIRVRWNSCNIIVSSMILLDEQHMWKVMTRFPGSSPCFPSNFGMHKGSLVGTTSQFWLWAIRLLVSLLKSSRFKEVKNDI